jgi:hypothetical protein
MRHMWNILSFFIVLSMGVNAYAAPASFFSITKQYLLSPNKPVSMTLPTRMSTLCTLRMENTHYLLIKVLKGNAVINNSTLAKGQSTTAMVFDQKTISVVANADTIVEFTNLGRTIIQATCSN